MEQFYFSPFTLVALVPIIVEALKKQFKWKSKILFSVFKRPIAIAQVVSMAVAIILALIGYFIQLGFFVDMQILWSIAWGILIGFSASGMFMAGYLDVLYSFFHSPKSNTL